MQAGFPTFKWLATLFSVTTVFRSLVMPGLTRHLFFLSCSFVPALCGAGFDTKEPKDQGQTKAPPFVRPTHLFETGGGVII